MIRVSLCTEESERWEIRGVTECGCVGRRGVQYVVVGTVEVNGYKKGHSVNRRKTVRQNLYYLVWTLSYGQRTNLVLVHKRVAFIVNKHLTRFY